MEWPNNLGLGNSGSAFDKIIITLQQSIQKGHKCSSEILKRISKRYKDSVL